MKKHILILEDDESLGYLLKEQLEGQGYSVKWYTNGVEAWKAYEPMLFDICLIDVIVPGMDGLEVVKRIKKVNKNQAIMFLTARSLRSDVISGYDAGADDYIVKPFETFELLLKIKALISRLNSAKEEIPKEVKLGNTELHPDRNVLRTASGEQKINRTECEILKYLMSSGEEVVTRNFLLEQIWERNDMYTSKSLDTYLSRVRKLLLETNLELVNIYGRGYVLKVHS